MVFLPRQNFSGRIVILRRCRSISLKILDFSGEIVLRRKSKSPVCTKFSVQGAHRARNRVGEVVPGLAASSRISGSCLCGTFAALKILRKNHDSPENHYFSGKIDLQEKLWENHFALRAPLRSPGLLRVIQTRALRLSARRRDATFRVLGAETFSPENLRRTN